MAQRVGLTIFLLLIGSHCFISPSEAQGIQSAGLLTEVLTTYGNVRGKIFTIQTSNAATTARAFIGIPYAKPPIADLRFQLPEDPTRWQGTLNATDRRVLCPQMPSKYSPKTTIPESEDCLHLNVYTRMSNQQVQTMNSRPVLVYFHGGDFVYGGKDFYSPDYFLENNDVVIVIVNYRLGILGFLNTNDQEVPGNFGLHDQVMALKWVKMNIDRFGGNPSNVTIFGHDAGAISVSLHILSKKSQGLFSAAISSSGTAFVPGVIRDDQVDLTFRVARRSGCSTKSTYDLAQCLRKKDYQELIQASKSYGQFGPVVDKNSQSPFLNDRPFALYWTGDYQRVPYISGVTRNEGTLEYFDRLPEARKEMRPDKVISAFLRPRLPRAAPVDVIAIACKYHYNLRMLNATAFTSLNNNLTQMVSDFVYKSANDLAVKLHSRGNAPTYMYVFEPANYGYSYGPSLSYLANNDGVKRPDYGVAHMDDMFYLFRTAYDTQIPGSNGNDRFSQALRNTFLNNWYSFATSGRPSSYGWLPLTNDRLSYLSINGQQNRIGVDYRQYDMDFWNEMILDLILQASYPTSNPLITRVKRLQNYESATWGMVGAVLVLVILCVALVAVIITSRRKSTRSLKLLSHEQFERSSESRETHL